MAAAPWLVWGMASGLEPHAQDAAIRMTRWMFPYIACMSLVALASGALNTWKHFAVPAATPVLLNVAMIGAAWLGAPVFARWGIEPIFAMAAGVMLGGLLQLGLQVPALARLGLLPRVAWRWGGIRQAWADSGTQAVLRLMLPALLGAGVAQISMLINTQIASYLAAGSVSWVSYADRLMEFPTGMLGVALGVVLMPELARARTDGDTARYATLLDWGLRLVLVLALPSAVALLVFSLPLVATLLHHGAFQAHDVRQTSLALAGYGVGLLGLVAIKVLAPGYYASQDIRTPVRIAVVVLLITQVLNMLLVPLLQHAALTLSIGIGALINALWLLLGLLRRGSYKPQPGWWRLWAQVLGASLVLAAFLLWANQAVPWLQLKDQPWRQIGYLSLAIVVAALLYFGTLAATGLKLRSLVHR